MWALWLNRCSLKKNIDDGSIKGVYPVRSEKTRCHHSCAHTLSTATTQCNSCQHTVRMIWKRLEFWGHQIGIQTLDLPNSVFLSKCSISLDFNWLLYKNGDKNINITKLLQGFQLHKHINVSNIVFSTSRCSKDEIILFSILFLFRQKYVAAMVCNHIWVFDSQQFGFGDDRPWSIYFMNTCWIHISFHKVLFFLPFKFSRCIFTLNGIRK